MQLTSLSIRLETYGSNEGKYAGSAHFKNVYGAVEIVLSPEISQRVLELCADALVANAKSVAQDLTAAILTQAQTPALENKVE